MKAIVIAFFILIFSKDSFAQIKSSKDPIDIEMEKCFNIANMKTHADQLNCMSAAYNEWDIELNKVYKELMTVLKPNKKAALQTAQIEWLKYRELEYKLLFELYGNQLESGTMGSDFIISAKVDFIKQRVLELRRMLPIDYTQSKIK